MRPQEQKVKRRQGNNYEQQINSKISLLALSFSRRIPFNPVDC
jgi:hypothetical protein